MRKFRVIETRVYFIEGADVDDAGDRFCAMTDEEINRLDYVSEIDIETIDN